MRHETIPAYEYHIAFWHYENNELYDGARSGTHCQLLVGQDAVTEGLAILKPGERYDPIIGRQVALARALEEYPEDTANLFWQVYYNHFGAKEYQKYIEFLKVGNYG